jgi:hypothetical protein
VAMLANARTVLSVGRYILRVDRKSHDGELGGSI